MSWLTIAIQSHNFAKRLNWMLCSIPTDINISVACMDYSDDCAFLRDNAGPNVEIAAYDDYDYFQYRGNTRTEQVKESTTPYILFADADMVYAPGFFVKLQPLADAMTPRTMLIAGRWSQPNGKRRFTDRMINRFTHGNDLVGTNEQVWDEASKLRKVKKSNVGAGYFQLVRTEDCAGYYVDADKNRDHGWTNTYSKCRSDQQFRKRFQRVKLPRWFSEHQIHLNHSRDNEVGHHLEKQR